MRVITPGRREWEKERHIVCTNRQCCAVLGVKLSEMTLCEDQRDGNYYLMNCPECRKDIYIAASVFK